MKGRASETRQTKMGATVSHSAVYRGPSVVRNAPETRSVKCLAPVRRADSTLASPQMPKRKQNVSQTGDTS